MAARERVLTQRELNRATLARQLLLKRERVPVVKAVERLGGLQAQEPAAPFVGLWGRLEGFEAEELRAAIARRAVVKATLMRGTLHLVSAADWAHLQPLLGTATARRGHTTPEETMSAVSEATLAFARQPRSNRELNDFVAGVGGSVGPGQWWRTRTRIPLLHAPTGGPWCFGLQPRLVAPPPRLRARLRDADAGARLLLVRHLAAFGPAAVADIARWSHVTTPRVRQELERLGSRLERLRAEDGRVLHDLRGAPRPDGDVAAPPRFLPMWDSAILAFDDRTRILPEEHRGEVVNRQGDVRPTFLVDGVVAGMWRTNGGRVELLPFAPLPRQARRELEEEARRLEAWLAPNDPRVFSRYTGKLSSYV